MLSSQASVQHERQVEKWRCSAQVNAAEAEDGDRELENQVIELEATIERLQEQKLERERQKVAMGQSISDSYMLNAFNLTKHQVADQQLQEQNGKMLTQMASHLGQLQQLEHAVLTCDLAKGSAIDPVQLRVGLS